MLRGWNSRFDRQTNPRFSPRPAAASEQLTEEGEMGLDYIARCTECGRLLGWASQSYEVDHKDELARLLSDWIKYGSSIERMETEAVRKADWDHAPHCTHYRKSRWKNRQKSLI